MLEKFEDFIKHSKRDEDITDLEISKHDDDYKLTYFTTAEGAAQTIEERYSYIQENDTFQLFYKKDIPTTIRIKNLEGNHEEAYQFKGTDDPEFQKVLRWKLRLTPFEYLMIRANADHPYSTEFLEEIDKEAEKFRIQKDIVTSEPNLIRYPDKYNTSTDNFINDLALYDPSNIEVAHSGEPLITGFFDIDDIEGLPSHITNENLMFLEGAFNLYLNGIEAFTPEVLYRYSIGNKDARVTEQQKERAIASVERMATIRQELDLTPYIQKYGSKEAKAHLKEEPEGAYIIKSYMLPVEEVTERVQGKRQKTVYRLIQAPALLKYNDWLANDRIGQIDKELLDTLSTSVEDSLIKRYLAKRLIALENPNNRMSNPVINFETLYDHIDVEEPDKYKRKKVREDVCAVLDYWKAIKRIKGYKLTKKGRAFTGVELNYIKRRKAIK